MTNLTNVFNSSCESFFHYTSLEALKNIISNSSLRFTNCMFLNDKEEYISIKDIVSDVLAELSSQKKDEYWINSIKDVINDEYFDKNLSSVLKPIDNSSFASIRDAEFFVFSASLENDSLPMWHYYSKGNGYSIEFETSAILEKLKMDYGEIIYGPIIYDSEIQKELIKKQILIYKEEFDNDCTEDALSIFEGNIWDYLNLIRLFFKRDSFQYEREFRIVVLSDATFRNNYNEKNADTKDLYHEKYPKILKNHMCCNGVLKPYIEIQTDGCLPIKTITLSPLIGKELGKSGVVDLLKTHGYERNYNIEGCRMSNSNYKTIGIKTSERKVRY